MEDLSSYLKKFKRILFSNDEEIKIVLEETKKIVDVPLFEKDLEISGTTVIFHSKPIIKNEIFLKKDKILSALQEKGLAIKSLR